MLGLFHSHMAPGHTPGQAPFSILRVLKHQNVLTVANQATVRQSAHQPTLVINSMPDITMQANLTITTVLIAHITADLDTTRQIAELLVHHSALTTSSLVMTLLTVELAAVLTPKLTTLALLLLPISNCMLQQLISAD